MSSSEFPPRFHAVDQTVPASLAPSRQDKGKRRVCIIIIIKRAPPTGTFRQGIHWLTWQRRAAVSSVHSTPNKQSNKRYRTYHHVKKLMYTVRVDEPYDFFRQHAAGTIRGRQRRTRGRHAIFRARPELRRCRSERPFDGYRHRRTEPSRDSSVPSPACISNR